MILRKYVGFMAEAVGRQLQCRVDGIECVRLKTDVARIEMYGSHCALPLHQGHLFLIPAMPSDLT